MINQHYRPVYGSPLSLRVENDVEVDAVGDTRHLKKTSSNNSIDTGHHFPRNYKKPKHGSSMKLQMTLRFFILFMVTFAFAEFFDYTTAMSSFASINFTISRLSLSPDTLDSPLNSSSTSAGVYASQNALHHPASDPPPATAKRFSLNMYSKFVQNFSTALDFQQEQLANLSSNSHAYTNPNDRKFGLDLFWSKDNAHIRACRLNNVCIRSDGTILMDKGLKLHSTQLKQCQVGSHEYFKDSMAEFNENDATSKINLFGSSPARYHIPHFLSDVLPVLYISELIYPTKHHESRRYDCMLPNQYHPTKCPSIYEHHSSQGMSDETKHVFGLFVEDRVMSMKVSDWVPQFTGLLSNSPILISKESVLAEKVLSKVDEEGDANPRTTHKVEFKLRDKACFNSIISFPKYPYILKNSMEWMSEEGNNMFSDHGLTRASVIRNVDDSKGQPYNEKNKCKLNIVLMNRKGWIKKNGLSSGRDLMNIDDVRERILTDSKKSFMTPNVITTLFEEMPFSEQVEAMQKADILVGVHGAGLSNMVFARRDTPLIEIFPFTYYAGPFGGLSYSLHILYSSVISSPDTKTFLECIDFWATKKNDTEISNYAKRLWVEALKKSKLEGDQDHLRTHAMSDPYGTFMKMCSRTQRLTVDPADIAKRVLSLSTRVCGASIKR